MRFLFTMLITPREYQFSGERNYRGQYKTASGKTINADVNGALNSSTA